MSAADEWNQEQHVIGLNERTKQAIEKQPTFFSHKTEHQ